MRHSEYLDGLRAEDRAARYDFATRDPGRPSTLVALNGDTIWGFATVAPAAKVTRRDWRGTRESGAQRSLLLRYRQVVLWVLLGNTRSQRFYEHDGWASDGLRRAATVWGATAEETTYSRNFWR